MYVRDGDISFLHRRPASIWNFTPQPERLSGEGLACWPAFPIVIKYDKVSLKDKDNLIAALRLEHPYRVSHVTVCGVTRSLWGKMDTAMRNPFPDLTHLWLTGPKGEDRRAPILPGSLLGGGTPHLVEL